MKNPIEVSFKMLSDAFKEAMNELQRMAKKAREIERLSSGAWEKPSYIFDSPFVCPKVKIESYSLN